MIKLITAISCLGHFSLGGSPDPIYTENIRGDMYLTLKTVEPAHVEAELSTYPSILLTFGSLVSTVSGESFLQVVQRPSILHKEHSREFTAGSILVAE